MAKTSFSGGRYEGAGQLQESTRGLQLKAVGGWNAWQNDNTPPSPHGCFSRGSPDVKGLGLGLELKAVLLGRNKTVRSWGGLKAEA